MNKNNTADDVEIQDFIDAAQAVVQREVGPVVPTSFTETLAAPVGRLVLSHRPVISITSVTELGTLLSPSAYRIDVNSGILERANGTGLGYWASLGSQADISVTYLAGQCGPVPANYRLATLELVAHLWRTSQMGRNRRVRGSGPEDDTQTVGLGFSLPNRVRELLGARQPVQARGEREILGDGQLAVQAERLGHVSDARLEGGDVAAEMESEHLRDVRLDVEQPRERSEERGLPRAVGADERDDLPRGDREVDAAERLVPAEAFPKAAQRDQGRDRPLDRELAHGPASSATRETLPSVPGWKRSTSSRMRTFTR